MLAGLMSNFFFLSAIWENLRKCRGLLGDSALVFLYLLKPFLHFALINWVVPKYLTLKDVGLDFERSQKGGGLALK